MDEGDCNESHPVSDCQGSDESVHSYRRQTTQQALFVLAYHCQKSAGKVSLPILELTGPESKPKHHLTVWYHNLPKSLPHR